MSSELAFSPTVRDEYPLNPAPQFVYPGQDRQPGLTDLLCLPNHAVMEWKRWDVFPDSAMRKVLQSAQIGGFGRRLPDGFKVWVENSKATEDGKLGGNGAKAIMQVSGSGI
jgi:hypothetical protein